MSTLILFESVRVFFTLGCFFPVSILKIYLNVAEISTVQDYLWPLAFESSFRVNHHIQDFNGDIPVFCLGIMQEFLIFHFLMLDIKF